MLKTRDDPAGAEARDTDAEDMTGAELGVTVSDTVLEVARPPESVTVTVAVCVPEVRNFLDTEASEEDVPSENTHL